MRPSVIAGIIAIPTALAVAPAAQAGSPACAARSNNTEKKLLECVTLEGARAHQAALQAIADANDGTRATGTPGYDASVEYVQEQLEAAGYQVELDPFPFTFFAPAELQQLTPVDEEYETGVFTGSGVGDVTGPVIPVDLALAPPRDPATSGSNRPISPGSISPAPTTSP